MDLNPGAAPPLIIVNAGGFGRTVANFAALDPSNGVDWQVSGFLDGRAALAEGAGLPILGDPATFEPDDSQRFLCALGMPAMRRSYAAPLLAKGARFINLCSGLPRVLSPGIRMGVGCIFEHDVKMGNETVMGDFVLVQSTSVIGYQVLLGSYVTVGCFVFIGGGAEIGEGAIIHPHATILPRVKVGEGAVVGAGSVVMANVPAGVTVLGNPAKIFRFK